MRWLNDCHKKMLVMDVRLYMLLAILFSFILTLPTLDNTSLIRIDFRMDAGLLDQPFYIIIGSCLLLLVKIIIKSVGNVLAMYGLPTLFFHKILDKANPYSRITGSVLLSVSSLLIVYMIVNKFNVTVYDVYATIVVTGISYYTYSLFKIRNTIPPLLAGTTIHAVVIILIGFSKLLS